MGIESSQLHQSVRMHRNTKSPKKMLYRVRLRQTSSDQLIFNLWQESIDHPTTSFLISTHKKPYSHTYLTAFGRNTDHIQDLPPY